MIVSVCTRVNRQKILYDSGICSVYAKHILSSSWMGRKEKINIHKKKKKITLFTFHFISDFFFHSFCVFACGYFTWLEAYISTYTHCLDPSSLITMDTFMLHFFFLALLPLGTYWCIDISHKYWHWYAWFSFFWTASSNNNNETKYTKHPARVAIRNSFSHK